jgi:DMSO/TMAO reductase YedYZ heme-binding membrane subunit
VAAEHATKIYTVAVIGIVVIVAFLALTSVGHVIDAATQHFMLYYAGVFALITLCASVGLGLVATDRMFMSPGHRVLVQSAHRAASFGAVAFLIIHIVTEILAQRVHVLDAVIPFLSPFRTFYIGLGTIASDLILLLLITGILRGRFNESGKAWRWRAIHYTSYLAFVFGVWHGLLGGRAGKPYVDWSYGFVVAFVLLGLAVRVLSNSLRPKENLSAPPVDMSANSASAPLRAAAMLAQYGGSRVGRTSILGGSTGSQPVLSAPISTQVLTALPAGGAETEQQGQPYYEPGYEGPPRYLGAPRSTGSGPMQRPATGPMPRAATGSLPRAATGPMPRAATGPMPRPGTGPMPRPGTGPMPRAATGPMPRATGPMPRATGSMPAAGTGPLPPVSGPMPSVNSGPMPRGGPGPRPRGGSGPMPRAATGPMPRSANEPYPGPYPASGPYPAPLEEPRGWTGPMPRAATGSQPQMDDRRFGDWGTGPQPRPQPGPASGGRGPRGGTGPRPRPTGPIATGTGEYRRPATGPMPQPVRPAPQPGYPDGAGYPGYSNGAGYPDGAGYPGYSNGAGRGRPDRQDWQAADYDGGWYPDEPQWDSALNDTDPNLRYREPGPGMPGYRGSREHRYGGDRY